MKRLFLVLAIAAVASFAVATTASADVARNGYLPQTATFTVTSPMAPGDWQNVWTQVYTVNVNSDGTFAGTGHVSNKVNSTVVDETVTGSFSGGTVSFHAVRPDGFEWSLIDAPFDGTTVTDATVPNYVPWIVEMTVSNPHLTNYKNHGDFVSSQAGGAEAAHSPIGMPVNADKNK